MQSQSVTLDILSWLTGAGFSISTATMVGIPEPEAYFNGSIWGMRHSKLGRMVAMSYQRHDSIRSPDLIKFLKSASNKVEILSVTSGVDAYIEVGELLFFIDGSVPEPKIENKTWTVQIYGKPQVFLDNEQWLRTFPKPKVDPKKPKVHFLCQNADGSLSTTEVEIKTTRLSEDAPLFYGEDFPQFHEKVLTKLQKESSGMVLLHGPPGGGKTTYIRHLTSCLMRKKRLILIPKSVVEVLGTPKFTTFLLGLRTSPSILVIEDAEEAIAAGSRATGAATSTLLNLTDGILNDIAGIQAIVTFNCPVSKVDPAILRSGRLIGMREFGPLSAKDARTLAEKKGLDASRITGPTMLCDVLCNQVIGVSGKPSGAMGFNR